MMSLGIWVLIVGAVLYLAGTISRWANVSNGLEGVGITLMMFGMTLALFAHWLR